MDSLGSIAKSVIYNAGFDCGKNGANTTNSHFKFFSTQESMELWSLGKKNGEKHRAVTEPARK